MEADTARVTLFDGGDIMYGNNVNESPRSGLDWRWWGDGGGGRRTGNGEGWGVAGESRGGGGLARMEGDGGTEEQLGKREGVGLDVIVF